MMMMESALKSRLSARGRSVFAHEAPIERLRSTRATA